MTRHQTRYFVIASLLVIVVGLGTGLVAYYFGFPTNAFQSQGGPDELRFVPRDVAVLAYANVRDIMVSGVRQKLRDAMPGGGKGQADFQAKTGINIETDIDRVVASLTPTTGDQKRPSGLVIARGRLEEVRIEALTREHGARVESYGGRRLIIMAGDAQTTSGQPPNEVPTLAFVEPGLVAVGSLTLVRRAIDLKNGGDSVATNDEVMTAVRGLGSETMWAVGRFDALTAQAKLPTGMLGQLPPITWFSASARVTNGVEGTFKAEAADEQSA